MEGNIYKAPAIDIRRLRRVQEAREKYGARHAFSVLKPDPARLWAEARGLERYKDRQVWEEDGIRFIAEIKYDNEAELEYPGRYASKGVQTMRLGQYRVRPWADKATQEKDKRLVELHNDEYGVKRRNPGRREHTHVVLQNLFEDYFNGLWELGYTKHAADCLARSYIARDVRRVEDYGNGWSYVFVIVTARCELVSGVALEEDSSVSGIETDSEDEYILEAIKEQAHEAQAQLEEKKERIEKELREKYAGERESAA